MALLRRRLPVKKPNATSRQALGLWFVCGLLRLALTFTLFMCVKYLERRRVA
jgi:hypothetical protein